MSKSRIGPEAKIITLFNSLSDESKRIVLDVIKAQAAAPRKASTKKQASAPAPLPVDKKPRCNFAAPDEDICDRFEDNLIHDPNGGYVGYHPFEPSKSVARAPRKSRQKSESTPSIQSTEGETVNAMSASSGGD